jgi:hypothetical protein
MSRAHRDCSCLIHRKSRSSTPGSSSASPSPSRTPASAGFPAVCPIAAPDISAVGAIDYGQRQQARELQAFRRAFWSPRNGISDSRNLRSIPAVHQAHNSRVCPIDQTRSRLIEPRVRARRSARAVQASARDPVELSALPTVPALATSSRERRSRARGGRVERHVRGFAGPAPPRQRPCSSWSCSGS